MSVQTLDAAPRSEVACPRPIRKSKSWALGLLGAVFGTLFGALFGCFYWGWVYYAVILTDKFQEGIVVGFFGAIAGLAFVPITGGIYGAAGGSLMGLLIGLSPRPKAVFVSGVLSGAVGGWLGFFSGLCVRLSFAVEQYLFVFLLAALLGEVACVLLIGRSLRFGYRIPKPLWRATWGFVGGVIAIGAVGPLIWEVSEEPGARLLGVWLGVPVVTALVGAFLGYSKPRSSARIMGLALIGITFASIAGLSPSSASTKANGAPSGAQNTSMEYRLLIYARFLPGWGMQVTYVDPGGPAAWLQGMQGQRGSLEPGDIIRAVDGQGLQTQQDYYRILNASDPRDGWVRLTVWDVRTRRDAQWNAHAVRVQVIGPQSQSREPLTKVLLIGLTKDPSLGKMIEVSLAKILATMQGVPGIRDQDIVELRGDDVNASNILQSVDRLTVRENETLFCYYIGHGAYDSSRATGDDPSGGHFFQIPSGDLMRQSLANKLLAKRARLTVLISDTCNVQAQAMPAPVYEHRQLRGGENRVLNDLLLRHTGVINVSGSSRDQFGWFSLNPGGWFSEAFVEQCNPDQLRNESFVTWDMFLRRLSDSTSREFQTRKSALMRSPGTTRPDVLRQLQGQFDQRPQVFVQAVSRTAQ